jgi:hypothetical protein
VITMDSSKDIQWEMAKDEIEHVKNRMKVLLSMNDISIQDISMYFMGPQSKFGLFMQQDLDLDQVMYLKFMGTLCIQGA